MPKTVQTKKKALPQEATRKIDRKFVISFVAAIALVAVVVVVVATNLGGASSSQPAAAVPAPVTYRPLAGAGSDTTQGVMDALSKNITDIASYPVAGGRITTKSQAANPQCAIDRPGSDVTGIEVLIVQQVLAEQAGTKPCIDFARGAVNTSGIPGLIDANLTFIPFAVDADTFVQRADSTNPRSLTRAQLKAIFTCSARNQAAYQPLLPQYGSGLRENFLTSLGLMDVPTYTKVNTCVAEIDPVAGKSESVGVALSDPRSIAPYSVAEYLSQTNGTSVDVHGRTVLGVLDGRSPLMARAGATVGIVHRTNGPRSRIDPDQLKALYTCSAPGGLQTSVQPLLPPPGSVVRAAFLSAIGVPDSADFTAAHPCVSQVAAENDGRLLTTASSIMPYAVDQYLAQVGGKSPDNHGSTILGPIDHGPVAVIDPRFPTAHAVYNIVPTKRIGEAPTSTVFVGPNSQVCAATATIIAYGFAPAPKCGDTSIHTPS